MGVNISNEFHRTSTNPIDDSLTLSKTEMLNRDDNLMPSKYFTICTDDGCIYLYDKSATPNQTTGKFTKFEGGGGTVKDGNIDFGGSDRDAYGYGAKEGLSPCDTLFTEIGGNRFAFMPASLITVEYSRDGGSTWTNYGSSDNAKKALFTLDAGTSFTIGKADSTNKATTSANYNKYMLRVTINSNGSTCYARFKKFILNISTSGSSGSCCDFQGALQGSPTTFTTIKSGVTLSGWSGYNVINLDTAVTTYGNRSDQYQYLRWVFRTTAAGNTSYNGLTVYSIKGFADTAWNVPSTMARTGHLYSYDENGNASFPAQITATQFNGNVTNVNGVLGTFDAQRHVWFSDGAIETARNYDDDFKYNPSSKVLSLGALSLAGGRTIGSGDDEGIVVGFASNNWAGVCLGNPSARRSVFYLNSTAGQNPIWRYNDGTTSYNISHPAKSGTIALTSDIPSVPTKVSQLTNDSGYTTNTGTITKVGNTISGAATVSSNNNTASWGSAVTVGSVGGVDLKFTMPSNPNTNTTYSLSRDGASVKLTPSSGTAQTVSLNDLINGLSTGSDNADLADYLVAQYARGGSSQTTYHRKPVSKVVNANVVKSALGTGTGTTKFLREDGTWQTPAYPTVPTKTSQLTNDSNFISSIPAAAQSTRGGIKIWVESGSNDILRISTT